MFSVTC